MRKSIVVLLVAGIVWVVGPRATVSTAHARYVDYYGKNLFLGIAYHRWGCVDDGTNVVNNNTYQGFTGTQYCYQGTNWQNVSSDIYLGYNSESQGDSWMGYYFCYANWDYGMALSGSNAGDWHNFCHSWQSNYGNNDTFGVDSRSSSGAPNACSYSVLSNCNSDCWIKDFSQRQGGVTPWTGSAWGSHQATVDIASPGC